MQRTKWLTLITSSAAWWSLKPCLVSNPTLDVKIYRSDLVRFQFGQHNVYFGFRRIFPAVWQRRIRSGWDESHRGDVKEILIKTITFHFSVVLLYSSCCPVALSDHVWLRRPVSAEGCKRAVPENTFFSFTSTQKYRWSCITGNQSPTKLTFFIF